MAHPHRAGEPGAGPSRQASPSRTATLTCLCRRDGNVHGWLWFYFVNEQLLRYLNLRVPRDYDTVPLWLFWGLCLVWLMPWSAFVFKALDHAPFAHSDTQAKWREAPPLPHALDVRMRTHAASARSLGCVSCCSSSLLHAAGVLRSSRSARAGDPHRWLARAGQSILATDHASRKKIRRANLRATAVLLALGAIFAAASLVFLLHTRAPAPSTDLAELLQQNPADYALSMGHFLDLNAQALGLFRLPLALAAAALFLGPLASFVLRKKAQPHAATLALAAGAFGFLLAAHLGLQTFAPVLSSQQLAASHRAASPLRTTSSSSIRSTSSPARSASTSSGPATTRTSDHPVAVRPASTSSPTPSYNGTPNYGRSSNLWYGSFFPDAPAIFETPQSLAQKWPGPQRIFLWQDLANQPSPLPALPGPVYVIASSGGKEIVSNQRNRP